MSEILISIMKRPAERPAEGCGCVIGVLAIATLMVGMGRCAGADWAKTEAEKNIGKEIGWGTKAELDAGKRYDFTCPEGGSPGDVVGSGFYEARKSSICSAAVHAGVIDLRTGGRVTIDVQEKTGLILRGSERNGIRSADSSEAKERQLALTKGSDDAEWSDTVFTVVGAPPELSSSVASEPPSTNSAKPIPVRISNPGRPKKALGPVPATSAQPSPPPTTSAEAAPLDAAPAQAGE